MFEEDGYIPYVESIAYLVGKNSRMGSDKVSNNAVADLLEIAADIKDGDKSIRWYNRIWLFGAQVF